MATTLAFDVGGTSIKAARLAAGDAIDAKASRRTPVGLLPTRLLDVLSGLALRLAPYDRVGVGFPGPVEDGVVLDGSNLTRPAGPGTPVDEELRRAWHGFELAERLERALGVAVLVANDADVAALACATGTGRELTVTLGTGVGTGLVVDGVLAPHVEHSDTPLLGAASLDELIGEPIRKQIDPELWQERVRAVLEHLDREVGFDRCTLAGGNARRVWRDGLGAIRRRLVVTPEPVGLLGCDRLFRPDQA